MNMITELTARKRERAHHVESLSNLQKKLEHEKTKLDASMEHIHPAHLVKEKELRLKNIDTVDEFVTRQSKIHREAIDSIDAELTALKAAL